MRCGPACFIPIMIVLACTSCVHAPDPVVRPSIQLTWLDSLPPPSADQAGSLRGQLIIAHNEAVAVANKNAGIAERLDKENALREQEAAKLKQVVKEQEQAHIWENIGHWLLEGGLVSALIVVTSGI